MVNDEFRHLLPPTVDKWAKARHTAFWVVYCLIAVGVSFLVMVGGSFMHAFITIAAFIFGPKLWRSIR